MKHTKKKCCKKNKQSVRLLKSRKHKKRQFRKKIVKSRKRILRGGDKTDIVEYSGDKTNGDKTNSDKMNVVDVIINPLDIQYFSATLFTYGLLNWLPIITSNSEEKDVLDTLKKFERTVQILNGDPVLNGRNEIKIDRKVFFKQLRSKLLFTDDNLLLINERMKSELEKLGISELCWYRLTNDEHLCKILFFLIGSNPKYNGYYKSFLDAVDTIYVKDLPEAEEVKGGGIFNLLFTLTIVFVSVFAQLSSPFDLETARRLLNKHDLIVDRAIALDRVTTEDFKTTQVGLFLHSIIGLITSIDTGETKLTGVQTLYDSVMHLISDPALTTLGEIVKAPRPNTVIDPSNRMTLLESNKEITTITLRPDVTGMRAIKISIPTTSINDLFSITPSDFFTRHNVQSMATFALSVSNHNIGMVYGYYSNSFRGLIAEYMKKYTENQQDVLRLLTDISEYLQEIMNAFKKIKNTAVTFAESDAGKFVVASLASGVKSGTSALYKGMISAKNYAISGSNYLASTIVPPEQMFKNAQVLGPLFQYTYFTNSGVGAPKFSDDPGAYSNKNDKIKSAVIEIPYNIMGPILRSIPQLESFAINYERVFRKNETLANKMLTDDLLSYFQENNID
jgi:hypothetical protein